MCGVTRAPFNSNRSSCGIEVVVPFFFYPNSNTLRCVPFQYTGFIDVFGANESRRRVNRAVPCTLAIEVRVASVEGHDALAASFGFPVAPFRALQISKIVAFVCCKSMLENQSCKSLDAKAANRSARTPTTNELNELWVRQHPTPWAVCRSASAIKCANQSVADRSFRCKV